MWSACRRSWRLGPGFQAWFANSRDNLILPSGLQSITFDNGFNQGLDEVILSSSLQSIPVGDACARMGRHRECRLV